MSKKPKARLFADFDLPFEGAKELGREETHYLANVMRVKTGAEIALFNGRDGEWLATVQAANRKSVTLVIVEKTREQATSPDIWLLFAPIKRTRFDFIAQKATELGVSGLYPVQTEYTNAERVKLERLKANAREAAEQCERLEIPHCEELQPLGQALATLGPDRKLMFCDEDLSGKLAFDALREAGRGKWAILIGPEGGFSESERTEIRAMPQTVTVTLGPRVLRADTAAIAALGLWQASVGDWQ